MFSFLSAKVEWPPSYYPIKPDRGTSKQTLELSSRREKVIHHPELTCNQPVPNTTQNPSLQCLVILR